MRFPSLMPGLILVGLTACTSEPRVEPVPGAPDPTLSIAPQGSQVLLARLGERIFTDDNLSLRRNQSCASCHDADWGFTGPDPVINAGGSVMPGSVRARFGSRKPPSAAYATPSPVLHFDGEDGTYVGGNFWDGRATGARLGSPSAEQSQFPFVNANEQALRDRACVIRRIATGRYAELWGRVYGGSIRQIDFPPHTDGLCTTEGGSVGLSIEDRAQVDVEYDRLARAIAAFEDSPEVNQFDSKYDAYLAGRAHLSPLERQGLALFEGKATCSACHPSEGRRALFTDYTFDNIGIPANPANPALRANPNFRDLGVGGATNEPSEFGKQKVPTLRNLDKRGIPGGDKAFMHNGALKSLEQVVHFYNTRDVLPTCATVGRARFGINCWPAPEVLENVNVDELGNLGLSPAEERAVVAFLKTLTDGWSGPGRRW